MVCKKKNPKVGVFQELTGTCKVFDHISHIIEIEIMTYHDSTNLFVAQTVLSGRMTASVFSTSLLAIGMSDLWPPKGM